MNHSSPHGYNETNYIIDPKRGVIVNTRSMDTLQNFIYTRNGFKSQRPDLSDYEFNVFKQKLLLGENFLNEMRKRLNNEITRSSLQTPQSFRRQKMSLLEDQVYSLSVPHIRMGRFHADRNWDEATLVSNYADKIFQKIKKYGLHVPSFVPDVSKQEAQELEENLAQRFLREMKKTPASV